MRKTLYLLLAVALLFVATRWRLLVPFRPPTAAEQLEALGMEEPVEAAYRDEGFFQPIPRPEKGDWLDRHYERGQTFAEYQAGYLQNREIWNSIALVGYGNDLHPPLDNLAEYLQTFFCLPAVRVIVRPELPTEIRRRENPWSGQWQWHAGDLIRVTASLKPMDSGAAIGVTMDDLYPAPTWNFVFGQADIRRKAGIFSFCRYRVDENDTASIMLYRRSFKVLVHETGHLLGLYHCIYWHCLMNGANHLRESDRTPLHLCPVCLRKLQHRMGFSIVDRYRKLADLNRRYAFHDEADWLERRLELLKQQH